MVNDHSMGDWLTGVRVIFAVCLASACNRPHRDDVPPACCGSHWERDQTAVRCWDELSEEMQHAATGVHSADMSDPCAPPNACFIGVD
jgi:hypothetical protein